MSVALILAQMPVIFWRGPILLSTNTDDGRQIPADRFEQWAVEINDARPVLYRPKAWPAVTVGMFSDLEVADGTLVASIVVSRQVLIKAMQKLDLSAMHLGDFRQPLYPEADIDYERGPHAVWLGYLPAWSELKPVVDADTVSRLWRGETMAKVAEPWPSSI